MDMTLSPQGCPPNFGLTSSTKEGSLQYRAGTTYLGKELWKTCYLVLWYGQVIGDLCILLHIYEVNVNNLFLFLAAMGYCTCMQKELMWRLWCQSLWGKLLLFKCRNKSVSYVHARTTKLKQTQWAFFLLWDVKMSAVLVRPFFCPCFYISKALNTPLLQ